MIINYNTTIFRLFAWIDMFEQFKDKKPFLGFHFGKPFRSERLEVSDMATQIVTENGWISLQFISGDDL